MALKQDPYASSVFTNQYELPQACYPELPAPAEALPSVAELSCEVAEMVIEEAKQQREMLELAREHIKLVARVFGICRPF